ncbi:hypothetical protein [Megamonas hypermegale]|uniref:hypothetical protein n=1 Tax=Megamonas hypermegale TaxID=158847 RepID=UPI00195AF8EF|nr:hypothetical protein [Megamonas hypermegale]MBM6761854.1 hypothetical protein [Megamonas hypermegale]
MQTVISGTDKQLYDMIIKLHDDIFKHNQTDFLIKIVLTKDTDLSLLQDFVSLAQDLQNDWNEEIKIEFNIQNEDETSL